MRHTRLSFLTVLVLGFLTSIPSFGCTANCPDGSSCSGNKTCGCTGPGGSASCSDFQPFQEATLATSEGLTAYSTYLATLNSTEARTLEQAAESMKTALEQNSLADYFAARALHAKALQSLSAAGWKALAAGGFLVEKPKAH